LDRFQMLTRSDGVPSGAYGETQNGALFQFLAEGSLPTNASIGGANQGTGGLVQVGPYVVTGGFMPVSNVLYHFTLTDTGQQLIGRIDDPNGQWVEVTAPMVADADQVKFVVFHNREATVGNHDCELDDVVIEQLGPRWQQASPTQSPAAPRGPAMALDAYRGRTVLFGGCQVDSPLASIAGASSDTWEWDGQDWLLCQPVNQPSARFFHSMAFDAARRRIVMFGGRDANGTNPADTTWEWDGSDWTNVTPTAGPSPREVAGLAYDAVRQRTVLFGGCASVNVQLADTWTWDGTQWTQMSPANSPQPRFGCAMAWDSTNTRVLLFGGFSSTSVVNDLWQWDGVNWTQVAVPGLLPPGRHGHALAFDDTRGDLVLFGGDPGPLGDTWRFDGTSWQQKPSVTVPTARRWSAAAFDGLRRQFVLFGGQDMTTGQNGNAADTWTWHDDSAWVQTFGSGCGPNGAPTLQAITPVLGTTFTMTIGNLPGVLTVVSPIFGFSIVQDGLVALPRDLSFLGMTGCTQWVAAFHNEFLVGAAPGVIWSFTIPNAPNLAGVVLYSQAAVFDPTAPFGISLSGALALTLGR
jgi:hypothetical protein